MTYEAIYSLIVQPLLSKLFETVPDSSAKVVNTFCIIVNHIEIVVKALDRRKIQDYLPITLFVVLLLETNYKSS